MKKNLRISIAIIIVLFSFMQACSDHEIKRDKHIASSEDVYTCSMHPQVLEHHPGDCPICGMKLVKKNTTAIAANNIELESLLKPVNEFVVTSLPVTTPQQKSVRVPVKVYGTLEYDTRAAGSISARVSGRVEKLYLRYRYQEVSAGQKIMEIYSPELVTAQQNLLFLLKSDADNISFINATKQRLLLLGMSENELNKIIQTGKPLYTVSIYSNYSGHVHDAGMSNDVAANEMSNSAPVTQELSLKEGMYVQKGQTLFMIMNHHQALAALQIFPDQQRLVKIGDAVRIIPETDTNKVIDGKIDFIEPFFRSNSKTLTARVYFHNMNMLTIGSHVSAEIYSGNTQGLWLPASAVISLGANEVAFKKEDGGFVAHKITAGIRLNNNVQILSGLSTTDTVAANAQYLMDSESLLKPRQNKLR
jgi:Cu(I)/Ag(I) efflux system membrane fusion protein